MKVARKKPAPKRAEKKKVAAAKRPRKRVRVGEVVLAQREMEKRRPPLV